MIIPKISIITPTYNCGNTIQRTIQSVVEQNYPNIEYLIIDGGSNDKTAVIVNEFMLKYPSIIKFVSEKDNGIYDAMNKGTKMSSGEWLLYLGGDDYLYDKNVLTRIFGYFDLSSYDLIYGNVLHGNGLVGSGEVSRKDLLRMNIPHQAILYKRAKVIELGGYNLKYSIMADKYLNLQIFSQDLNRIKYLDLIIAFFSHTGVSSNNYDLQFISDVDKIAIKYYNQYFSKKEIYQLISFYSFLNIKYNSVWRGLFWLYQSGRMITYWRDIIYCFLYRFGLRK